MTSPRILLPLLLMVGGCATALQKRADAAFERGEYVNAATLYDEAVREKPTRSGLITKRWEARAKAIDELVVLANGTRRAGRTGDALAATQSATVSRREWFAGDDASRLSPDLHKKVDELSAWAMQVITSDVRKQLAGHKPLAAQHSLKLGLPQFRAAQLESEADKLKQEIDAAGSARCAELKAADQGAYLTWWVASYCRAFAAEPPEIKADAEQVSALKIAADTLTTTTPEQREKLESLLEQQLLASPWYHPQATAMASVQIAGAHVATYTQQPAKREVHWTERVPYQVRESYQEAYTAYESRMVSEPYTTYRTESYSCGSGTSYRSCTRSVPSTQYRMVSRTQPVTKYRTAYRTVTRYRDEPRIFHYDVTEHHGGYSASWEISLTLSPDQRPLAIKVDGQAKQSADEHKVSFVPANVKPSDGRLMTHDEWFNDRLKQLRLIFPDQARAHWKELYCTGDLSVAESAARCARGAFAELPEAAKGALSTFLRDDAVLLMASAK